ncbi:SRPBCC family protein [Streptomyces phaeochromogenes]|uniref:SRPBCC family protein n=1 Tax=Streptomyces phaeochromogenes TaxID=1923 RepID=A0ABZ1HPG3_STRPH|nr:SRPBCC family protein [Streptomyces phaeochromogenes]WRZ34936.1 SRPBCC family protein [Streptomyces phaeochromogenes]WSD20150.1 SRPBCC family protein [Streptomyces phaeochromogenes]WSJ03159.1 SRPBCC family protein [Streptomyces phaeochromogenes]
MQLTNTVPIKASPDDVFALMNDVERVASCMPGAALDGQDGDTWRGRVKIRVGPISASYAGTVRFLEIDAEKRRLRVHARGTDTHGSGDAEAEVALEILAAPEGALLQLSTDLVIRGKIVQFGKGAIVTVSDRILQQFARNLGSLLDQDRAVGAASPSASPTKPTNTSVSATSVSAPAAAQPALAQGSDLDGLAMLLGPQAAKYGLVAGAFALGVLEGWLLGRLTAQARELRALRRMS